MNPVLLVTSLILSAAITASAATLDRVLAIVEQTPILASDVDNRLNLLRFQNELQGRDFPIDTAELRPRVLERLIEEQALRGEAEQQGFSVSDEQINGALSNLAGQLRANGIAALARLLTEQGINFNRVRDDTRTELLINAVKRRALENQIRVSDQEARALIEREGLNQGQVRLSEIFVALPPAPTPQQIQAGQDRIVMLARELANGASFPAVAAQNSDGAQAIAGGDLGWREISELPDAFRTALSSAGAQQLTQPFRSRSGFHILQLRDRRDSETVLVDEVLARHILLRPDAINDDQAVLNQARLLRQKIVNGGDFGDVAKASSQDPVSASKGGILGWSDPNAYVPPFTQAIAELPLNQVSTPVKTRFGWHLIEVLDRRTVESENVQQLQRAKNIIRERQADELLSAWTQQILESSYIERL